jgi:hypothetical protein
MTPWLTEPPRPGPVLLCPDTVSPCCGANIKPWIRRDDHGAVIQVVERVCEKCRREA